MVINKKILIVGNLARDIIKKRSYFGGSAGVIAVNTKLLGLEPEIMSIIGKDKFSQRYLKYLNNIDIKTDHVYQEITNIASCKIISFLNKNSCRQWTDNGVSQKMSNLNPEYKYINDFNLIHLVSVPSCLIQKILSILDKNKSTILSYEPGPKIIIHPEWIDLKILKRIDFLFGNEEEIESLVKYLNVKDPSEILNFGPKIIVETKGHKGSLIYTLRSCLKILPIKMVCKDPTGAGDAYKSGFLYGYLNSLSLEKCGLLGSNLASKAINKYGGILNKNETKKYKI